MAARGAPRRGQRHQPWREISRATVLMPPLLESGRTCLSAQGRVADCLRRRCCWLDSTYMLDEHLLDEAVRFAVVHVVVALTDLTDVRQLCVAENTTAI